MMKTKTKPIRRRRLMFLRRNLGIKILAVLLALFLWLNVVMQRDYVAVFRMPIELVNMPKVLVPANPFPSVARVKVSGTGKQLIGLKLFSKPKVMVDIFRAREGKRTVVINNADVFLGGADVRVVAIDEPQNIEITFDRFARKSVPAKNLARFSARKGFEVVGTPTLHPPQVPIRGPRKVVARVDTVFTSGLHLQELDHDTVVAIPLLPPTEFNVSCSARVVMVRVRVQRTVQRELGGIPVHLINLPPKVEASLDAEEVTLTIAGGEKIVNNFTPNDLQVYVDYRKFLADTLSRAKASIVKFKAVRIVGIEPGTFGVVRDSNGRNTSHADSER